MDAETGEILDDAQGYGYKTAQNAYLAWGYKTRDKSKDAEKLKLVKEILKWQQQYNLFSQMDVVARDVIRGKYGQNQKFNTKMVKELCKEIENVPYTARDILWTWRKGEEFVRKLEKKKR